MSDARDFAEQLIELRRVFDGSFAARPAAAPAATEDFLFVRAGGAAWALPLRHVGHVEVGTRITPAPSPVAELLGLASIRRALLPVYHLGALLGGDATAGTRWLVATAPAPLALGIDAFERHVRSPSTAAAAAREGADGAYVAGLVHDEDGSFRPILDLVALCHDIARRGRLARRTAGGSP